MNITAFKNPADIFRGTDFWMLNDSLTEDGIRSQIREMKEKGVYSFIARTYIGLKSDYPGKDFMNKMRIIVDTARECGLRVFIQAGYMPEAVVGLPQDCALRYIYPVKEGEEAGRKILCKNDGYSFTEHNSGTFLDMFDDDAVDFYLAKSYEEMWSEFADEYGKTILSVWVDEPSYNGQFLPWTPKLGQLFSERFGYELADKVWLLYTDGENCETVRYHYRTLMRDLMEDNYFKRVRDWCERHNLLFSGHLMGEDTITSQIHRAGAIMPYYKYFDIPGIDVLCGAMNWKDDPLHPADENALPYNLYNTAIQCVSAARQSGQKHILAEMYGVTTENMTFRNQLSMFDSYAAMGISHRSVHGIFYSLRGRGKRAYPPHINYYQPYWPKYKNVTDYCARVSEFISQGKTMGDIAVIHPLETGYTYYRASREHKFGGSELLSAYDKRFLALLRTLKTQHRDPELCDLATLRDMGSVKDGRLIVGEMSYRTVILPELKVITSDFVKLLEEFTAGGGRLFILGSTPNLLDGVSDRKIAAQIEQLKGAVKLDSLAELINALSFSVPLYRLNGRGSADILVNRRVCDNGINFFLYNDDCSHDASAVLETDGCYKVSVLDPFDGSIADHKSNFIDGSTKVPVTVPAGASLLLSFEKTAPATFVTATPETKPTGEYVTDLDGVWTVSPDGANTLLLEFCRFRRGNGEFSDLLPIVAVQNLLSLEEYRGEITLRYEINSSDALEGLSLALESPEEQQISIDGRSYDSKPNGYFCDTSFETIPLGSLSGGLHFLEIKRVFNPLTKASSSINSLFETQLGVELEPLYLLGNFTVRGIRQPSRNGCIVFNREFMLEKAGELTTFGELTGDGFPFYTGEITLSREFNYDSADNNRRSLIRIGTMNAAAGEVRLNGVHIGDINRAPLDIDCTNALKNGKNRLEIKLYNTLRNIIGPFHRPRGEVGNLFGGGYKNPDAAWLSVDMSAANWERQFQDNTRWTDNYNLVPLGINNIKLIQF